MLSTAQDITDRLFGKPVARIEAKSVSAIHINFVDLPDLDPATEGTLLPPAVQLLMADSDDGLE